MDNLFEELILLGVDTREEVNTNDKTENNNEINDYCKDLIEKVLMSMDVKALYVDINIETAAEIAAKMIEDSEWPVGD